MIFNFQQKTYLEILSDFTNKTLEGKLADQKLRALLVFSDLTEITQKHKNSKAANRYIGDKMVKKRLGKTGGKK